MCYLGVFNYLSSLRILMVAISCCSCKSFRSCLRAFSGMLILGLSGSLSDLFFFFFFFSLFSSGLISCSYEDTSKDLDDILL
jgi:hypothetical protein